jgi:hypothetical protein
MEGYIDMREKSIAYAYKQDPVPIRTLCPSGRRVCQAELLEAPKPRIRNK